MAQIGVTNYCPPVFLRKIFKIFNFYFLRKSIYYLLNYNKNVFIIIYKFKYIIKDMNKIYSHISSIVSSPLCGCPFHGVSFGYWYCDKIDFEESN